MLRAIQLLGLAFFVIFISSCSSKQIENESNEPATPGGKNYGGVFRINESEYFVSLFPHHIADEVSWRVASQVYEGLFKLNPENLTVENCLVEDFKIDSSQTVYTFRLRKGVEFHDNPCFPNGKGRELQSSDVIYSFTQLCTPSKDNIGASVFKEIVEGARAYYEAQSQGAESPKKVTGFRILDRYNFQIILNKPHHTLPYMLAGPLCFIYPKEAYDKYGSDMKIHAVGTGPFYLDAHSEKDFKEEAHLYLRKNPKYYQYDSQGNKLPFLEMIEVTFLHDKNTEMSDFKKGNYHSVYRLPTEDIIHLMDPENHELDDFEIKDVDEFSTHYIGYNNHSGPFSDINLRKAVSFAIDKDYLIEAVLDGEADKPAHFGITPLAFNEYESNAIKGYRFNEDSAKFYLKKTAFANGNSQRPFSLHLVSDGDRNAMVATQIKNQLKKILDLEIHLHFMELPELEEKIELGQVDFFMTGWLYQYPHPENFLNAFYSKNSSVTENQNAYPNLMRYVNPLFDEHYEKGMEALTDREAFVTFHKAEQILMQDAAITPLWYDEGYSLTQPYVQNYHINALQYRDFRQVYFKEAETLNPSD